jgi:metal-dependent hydrolase (beta-lactamase superfamily II)
MLQPTLAAQADFNARQAQLDRELLDYLDARSEATHRHYDHVLGLYGRRMDEIDERHVLLSRELVAHVHDLVKRIDLVLSEAERGRLSLESALRDLRARLARLEERLPPG